MGHSHGRLATFCIAIALVVAMACAAGASASTTVGWGLNKNGQLGDGTKTSSSLPVGVLVPPLDEVVQVSAGSDHSLALLSNGTVLAWGLNKDGQLGNGTTTASKTPIAVPGLTGVKQIAAGGKFSVALLENGTAVSWGQNPEGQLGDGLTSGPETCVNGVSCSMVPRPVVELKEAKQISASYKHTAAVLKDGHVAMWGPNSHDPGELGLGITTGPESCGPKALPCSTKPRLVCHPFVMGEPEPCPEGPYLTGAVAVSVGYSHTIALLEGGTAVAWGGNSFRELGAAGPETGSGQSKDRSYVPVKVNKLTNAVAVAAGHKMSLALLSDGTVVGWGRNTAGELGIGTTGESHEFPTHVCAVGATAECPSGPFLSGVTAISAGAGSSIGFAHSLALLSSGRVAAWGDNGYGELGNGTTTASDVPVLACAVGASGPCPTGPYLTGMTTISAGRYHSLAAN